MTGIRRVARRGSILQPDSDRRTSHRPIHRTIHHARPLTGGPGALREQGGSLGTDRTAVPPNG